MVAAVITAEISPIWLDWALPGTLIALFHSWFGLIQIPLPHFAFSFPLLKQAPSVYIAISWCVRLGPHGCNLSAGMLVALLGFVKMRKHSDRSFLQVVDGSKIIAPCVLFTVLFLVLCLAVRERSPCLSSLSGFSLGAIRWILVSASCAHPCGFLHSRSLSSMHSMQVQFCIGRWSWLGCGLWIRMDTWSRSVTFLMECLSRRHLEALLLMGHGAESLWYHAGSWACSWGDMRIAVRSSLCLVPTLTILMMSPFRWFAHWPLVGIVQDWRNALTLAIRFVAGGAISSIIMSTTIAHLGRVGEKFRYAFSHMMLINLLRACMSIRLSPPSSMGLWSSSIAILGLESSSHINCRVIFVSAFSMCLGMPWAFVRN